MKKTSKVLSLAVAGLMAFSTSAVTAFTASAAEPTDTNIYFEVPTEIWADAMVTKPADKLQVYAHTYAIAGDDAYPTTKWQTRAEQCSYVTGSGNVYSYNIDSKLKTSLKDGADYVVIFSIKGDKNYQTCNVTMGKSCYGDTIVVTGETYENSVDSQKRDYRSVWKSEANAAVYGPKLEITSTGRVVGESIPTSITAEDMVVQFLHEYGVTNANILTPESVQATCDNEFLKADKQKVYDQYVATYADELADPETYPNTASAEAIAAYLGLSVEPTTETEPTEPTTETEPTQPTTGTEPTQPTTGTEPTQPTTGETEPTEPVAQTQYVVAGTDNFCNVSWKGSPVDAPENVMTDNGDGTYSKVFTVAEAIDNAQIKVVENLADGSQNWIGDSTGNNITFNVTAPCDVTVTFNAETKEITVTGEFVVLVTDLKIETINAVGNGDGAWLNDANWDPTANALTEVSDKVYEITFNNVEAFDNYQVKFAANGAWTDSWGAAAENFTAESGVEFDVAYNGQNIVVNVPYELADVTLRIDLTNFDYASKTGAKATITVTDATPKTLIGDVNNDGKIDASDITDLQMYAAGFDMGYEVNKALADVDGNGTINVLDVTALQKYIAGGYDNVGNAGKELEVA